MASRLLAGDFVRFENLCYRLVASQQVSCKWSRFPLPSPGHSLSRNFGVLSKFSEKIKGGIDRNQNLQWSIKEIKDKAEELKLLEEDLKVRTKQTAEHLYKHVDGAWIEIEAKAKKVYADVGEKISSAKEEVEENFRLGKSGPEGKDEISSNHSTNDKDQTKADFSGEEQHSQEQRTESSNYSDTFFGKVKIGFSSLPPKVSFAFEKLKQARPTDMVKKGYDVVKDELKGNPNRRKRLEYDAPSSAPSQNVEKSDRTEVVMLPSKQSRCSKKWEEFKNKMRGNPAFKRISGFSEPVIEKSQEFAEDMRERWETSDHLVVHKIQDISETVLGESDTAMSFKEI